MCVPLSVVLVAPALAHAGRHQRNADSSRRDTERRKLARHAMWRRFVEHHEPDMVGAGLHVHPRKLVWAGCQLGFPNLPGTPRVVMLSPGVVRPSICTSKCMSCHCFGRSIVLRAAGHGLTIARFVRVSRIYTCPNYCSSSDDAVWLKGGAHIPP